MARREVLGWAGTLAVGIGLVGGGCAPPHDREDPGTAPPDPPVLAGEYEAKGGGDVASIGFYGTEYQLRPSSCAAGDEACVVHGTYRIDAALGTLVLRPDGSTTDTVWPLRVDSRAARVPASTPQSLHILLQLIKQDSCIVTNLGDSFTAGNVTYSRGTAQDDFEASVMTAVRQEAGSSPSAEDTFLLSDFWQDQRRTAASSCNSYHLVEGGDRPTLKMMDWHGIKVVDLTSCGDQSGQFVHDLYTQDGTPIAGYDTASGKTTYQTPPLAVLMRAMGLCQGS
jgi:hypothetical protein